MMLLAKVFFLNTFLLLRCCGWLQHRYEYIDTSRLITKSVCLPSWNSQNVVIQRKNQWCHNIVQLLVVKRPLMRHLCMYTMVGMAFF